MISFKMKVVQKGSQDLSKRIPEAIKRGLNDGGDKTRTGMQRALWKQTGVSKYGSVTKRIRTNGAGDGRLQYVIHALGPAIPIKEFPVKASVHGPVTANVWSNPHTFQRSFKSSVKGLLRARLTDDPRSKTRRLLGPNLAKELGKDQSAAAFEHGARTFVLPAILAHLGRVLGR